MLQILTEKSLTLDPYASHHKCDKFIVGNSVNTRQSLMSIHNLYFERGKGQKWRYVSSSFSKTFYDIAIVLCACLLSLNIIVSLEKLFGLREAQICREDSDSNQNMNMMLSLFRRVFKRSDGGIMVLFETEKQSSL